ncbi:MAG: redoxin domain-containing protein [Verrucomicrobia bacterium]|nr:redoxin domain-containing protein [Verrucomicrobiota bacterium]
MEATHSISLRNLRFNTRNNVRSLSGPALGRLLSLLALATWLVFLTPVNASPAGAAYATLEKEFQAAQQEYFKAYGAAKTDAERQQVAVKYPDSQMFAARFLELAEKNPKDPAAVDALVWVATRGRAGPAFDKALDILNREHLQSEKIGTVCQSLVYSDSKAAERLLRGVMEENTHHEAQGQATLSLGQFLNRRSKMNASVAESKEPEKLFELVVAKYADVKGYRGTLADLATAELFEIRNLGVGKVAPEIEGEDVEGKHFKLSEYRGKVVVIDFWGDW